VKLNSLVNRVNSNLNLLLLHEKTWNFKLIILKVLNKPNQNLQMVKRTI